MNLLEESFWLMTRQNYSLNIITLSYALGLVEKSEIPIFLTLSSSTSSPSLNIFSICSLIVERGLPNRTVI